MRGLRAPGRHPEKRFWKNRVCEGRRGFAGGPSLQLHLHVAEPVQVAVAVAERILIPPRGRGLRWGDGRQHEGCGRGRVHVRGGATAAAAAVAVLQRGECLVGVHDLEGEALHCTRALPEDAAPQPLEPPLLRLAVRPYLRDGLCSAAAKRTSVSKPQRGLASQPPAPGNGTVPRVERCPTRISRPSAPP